MLLVFNKFICRVVFFLLKLGVFGILMFKNGDDLFIFYQFFEGIGFFVLYDFFVIDEILDVMIFRVVIFFENNGFIFKLIEIEVVLRK